MQHAASPHSLALCAATLTDGMATCAVAEPLKALDGWMLLMPVGAFTPNDGRPGWKNTNADAVIAASKLPALIDFDHGTQTKSDSRAAAWIEELAPKGPNGEPGIWGRVEGTAEGKSALAAKTYRFFSPTFLHDAARVVTKIVGGSLVNNPALDALPALASTQQETALEELLAKLRTALGLSSTATVDEILAAITAQKNNTAATASQVSAIALAAGLTLAAGAAPSADQVTAICAKLKAPATGDAATVGQLQGEVATLTQRLNSALLSQDNKSAEDKVAAGIKDGKIAPALKDEMVALCKADPAKFDTMLAKAPVIVVGGKLVNEQVPEGELDAEQLAICKQAGVSPEAFKASLKAQKENV
jgi:phage I-like protein